MPYQERDLQLPPWLLAASRMQRRKAEYVQLGLSTLLDALSRDLTSSTPSSSGCNGWDWLESSAPGLLASLAITRQALFGTIDDYMDALGEKVGGRLEEFRDGWLERVSSGPAKEAHDKKSYTARIARSTANDRERTRGQIDQHPPALACLMPPHMRLHVLSIGAGWVRSGLAEARRLRLDKTEAARSQHRVSAAVAEAQGFGSRVGSNVAKTPDDALRACWAVLNSRLDSSRAARIDALALLGALAHMVSETRRCTVCFRWSVPGRPHCRAHSLAASPDSSKTQRQARYERSKRILIRLVGKDGLTSLAQFGRSQRPADWMKHSLWQVPELTRSKDWAMVVRYLAARPALCAYLELDRGRLDVTTIQYELRAKVDALESRPQRWLLVLQAADLWRCEEHARERTTGFRPVTIRSIEVAIRIARRLKKPVTQAALANALKVNPSTISKRLKRGAGLACVERLRLLLGSG